jgi:hypothetical protein
MATTLGIKVKDTFVVFSLLGLLAVGAPTGTVKAENLPDQSAVQIAPTEHGALGPVNTCFAPTTMTDFSRNKARAA